MFQSLFSWSHKAERIKPTVKYLNVKPFLAWSVQNRLLCCQGPFPRTLPGKGLGAPPPIGAVAKATSSATAESASSSAPKQRPNACRAGTALLPAGQDSFWLDRAS